MTNARLCSMMGCLQVCGLTQITALVITQGQRERMLSGSYHEFGGADKIADSDK